MAPRHPGVERLAMRGERMLRRVRRNPAGTALVVTSALAVVLALLFGAREFARMEREHAEDARRLDRVDTARDLLTRGRLTEARGILWNLPTGGSAAVRDRIDRARLDLEIVERLERIRWQRGRTDRVGRYDARAEDQYRAAFADAGIDVVNGTPQAAADAIRASEVRDALVAALDDWAIACGDLGGIGRCMEVARRADPDPWRDRVRDVTAWRDPARLAALAAESRPAEQPVSLLVILAGLLNETGGDSIAFLRRIVLDHPDDYWVNFVLAEDLGEAEEALGYYRAAIALRPDAVAAHVNLAILLVRHDRGEEAERHLRRAVAIDPGSSIAWWNLAIRLLSRGEHEEAVAAARESVRIGAGLLGPQVHLAIALLQSGRFEEAVAAYEAARLLAAEPGVVAAIDESLSIARTMLEVDRMLRRDGRDPTDPDAELALALAAHAGFEGRHARAARYYGVAFDLDPHLEGDPPNGLRHEAFAQAALVAAGRGRDAAEVDDAQRAASRSRALAWMRAELDVHADAFATADPDVRAAQQSYLRGWLRDWRLAVLRDPSVLAAWPEEDRRAFAALWAEVERISKSDASPR